MPASLIMQFAAKGSAAGSRAALVYATDDAGCIMYSALQQSK